MNDRKQLTGFLLSVCVKSDIVEFEGVQLNPYKLPQVLTRLYIICSRN